MSTQRSPKKTGSKDWHRADIVAELRKAGWSLRRLAVHHGYAAPNTLCNALVRPWPKAERLIAKAIGVEPATIWPSRYPQNYPQGNPKNNTLKGVEKQKAA